MSSARQPTDSRDAGPVGTRLQIEHGFALIGVMLLLFLVSGLIVALAVSGETELRIAQNYEGQAKARTAAEAGLNHAVAVVIDALSAGTTMTALLKGPDGLTGTVARDADNGSLEALGVDATQRIPRPPARRGIGVDTAYEARVFDEDDPARGVVLSAADKTRIREDDGLPYVDKNRRIVIRAIGYGAKNAVVMLEASVGYATTNAALVVNGNLDLQGNATIAGTGGSVHANGNMDVHGSPNVSQDATASGTYTAQGHPDVEGVSGGGYPSRVLPNIRAIDHLAEADYILTNAGRMTLPGGSLVCDTATGGHGAGCAATGWTYSAGSNEWSVTGNSMQNGTYYAQGSIRIGGNPGSAAHPVTVSFIAEGSVHITGNMDAVADDPGLFILTDGDLTMAGNPTLYLPEAQILVREQMSIAGNATLNGQILVQNVPTVFTDVTNNRLTGSFSLTYAGTVGGGSGAPTVGGWRQM